MQKRHDGEPGDPIRALLLGRDKAEVENQLEKKIKRVRSGRGGEYFYNEFDLFCVEHGIIHERTPPYSP